jgi:hypothetical protein
MRYYKVLGNLTQPEQVHSKISYGGYPKATIIRKWQKSIISNKLEEACFWTAEIDCSGWQADFWSKLAIISSKHIHIHNPRLPILLWRKTQKYKERTTINGVSWKELRNDPSSRSDLCQAVGVVTTSKNGSTLTIPKTIVREEEDFAHEHEYRTHSWIKRHEINKTVLTQVSRICYNIENRNLQESLRCLSLALGFEETTKKTDPGSMEASPCRLKFIPDASRTQWIWVLWEALIEGCRSMCRGEDAMWLKLTIEALCNLFIFDFRPTAKRTKMPLLTHAIILIAGKPDWELPVMNSTSLNLIDMACHNISLMYEEIDTIAQKRENEPPPPPPPIPLQKKKIPKQNKKNNKTPTSMERFDIVEQLDII